MHVVIGSTHTHAKICRSFIGNELTLVSCLCVFVFTRIAEKFGGVIHSASNQLYKY